MSSIESLREQIQNIDLTIIKNIALRQDLCKKIGRLKKQAGKQITDLVQEQKNFEFYAELSKQLDIDPQFIEHLYQLIVSHSKKTQ